METLNPNELEKPTEPVVQPAQMIDTSKLFQNDPEPVSPSPKRNVIKRLGKKKLFILAAALAAILVGGSLAFAQLSKSTDESVTQQTAEEKAEDATQPADSDSPTDDTTNQTTNDSSTPSSTSTSQPSGSSSGATNNTGSGGSSTGGSGSSGSGSTTTSPKTYGISYTNSCYSSSNVTIKKGDTVKFTNSSSRDMWPASDNHPSHTIYSEFDANSSIDPGGTYSFTFNKTGSWGYHDHLKPSCSGTITVQ